MRPVFVIDLDGDIPPADLVATFALRPWEEIEIVRTVADANMETLAQIAGVFPSKGQARKAGFSGPIPEGRNLWGTSTTFWVWNPKPPVATPTISAKRNKTAQWMDFADGMGWTR